MYFGPMGKVAGMRNMELWEDRPSEKEHELSCEIAETALSQMSVPGSPKCKQYWGVTTRCKIRPSAFYMFS